MNDFDPGLKSRIREAFEKPVTVWAKIIPTGFLLEGDDSPVPNLDGRVKGYPEANCLLRYFGARIVSHLPCSPVCEGTRKVGVRWLEIMRDIDEEAAGWLVKLLSSETTWDSYHGVVQVETPYFIGVTHSFPYMERHRVIECSSINPRSEE